jgi:hypothetical protein
MDTCTLLAPATCRRARATLAALAVLALSAGCATQFDGPEKVKGLRVLAVQAEPPEIGAAADGSGPSWPAASASIRTLVGHPAFAQDGDVHAIVLHLGCTAAPGQVAGTVCTQLSELSQPSDLLAFLSAATACTAPGLGVAGAITFSGLEACSRDGCGPLSVPLDPADAASTVSLASPTYALPADYSLAALPSSSTQRVLGADVVDLALALEAAPADVAPTAAVADACGALAAVLGRFQAAWSARPHLAALKWLHVRGPDMPAASPPNHNPVVSGITLAGAPLPAPGGTPLAAQVGKKQDLLPALPGAFDTLRETYQRFDTDARYVDTRQEDWAYSWFVTAGDVDHSHTQSFDEANPLDPGAGTTVVWLVVRDLRGGMAWTAGELAAP